MVCDRPGAALTCTALSAATASSLTAGAAGFDGRGGGRGSGTAAPTAHAVPASAGFAAAASPASAGSAERRLLLLADAGLACHCARWVSQSACAETFWHFSHVLT